MTLRPASFSFSTQAEAYACRAVVKGVIEVIAQWINDKESLHNLNLILTEACANVVQHAYTDATSGRIEICIRILPKVRIECTVSDWGTGFTQCPLNLKKPIPLSPPEAESGRGLFIISSLADSFAISNSGGKNTLHITVNTGSEIWVASE
ncbi:ATP-binding protein [Oleidesulfovibrio sp.]|uniref:ATP-binding protein n=1 Tax=Oleidesulfovibrio sp. TaxID=2909707 RepID=UPI003A88715B